MVSCVTPGQRIGSIAEYEGGSGTYQRGNYWYASLCGFKQIIEKEDAPIDSNPLLIVSRERELSKVPNNGSIATCRVTRVNTRYATVTIICCDDLVLKEAFSGIIRVQDVRETEVDSKTEIYKSFRPGDIVRAEVLSLGDSRSYYLTTARMDLGVIYAKSVAGEPMIPLSWESMLCKKTKMKEFRKVANIKRPAPGEAKE